MSDSNNNHTPSTEELKKAVQDRIKYVLGIYPKLSPSMLQMGIGTQLKPPIWRPVLREMVNAGIVKEELVESTTPAGVYTNHTILSLA